MKRGDSLAIKMQCQDSQFKQKPLGFTKGFYTFRYGFDAPLEYGYVLHLPDVRNRI